MSAVPILEVENVSKRFGNFVALNNVSTRFEAGKLSAIIGPNGAGKSTFFNVVSGAFPPSSGTLSFNGRDITGLAQHEFARIGIAKSFQITTVFQQLTAHENVRVAAQMRHARYQMFKPRAAMAELSERASALLERVGLADLQQRPASDLAHGQQRALEVAMALASDPVLLLMDEPTAGMAPKERNELMALTKQLVVDRGLAVLFTEHSMDVVFAHADRILVLARGRLIAEGKPAEIRENPQVQAVYFGTGKTFEKKAPA